jgi:hypothetical protein
MPEAPSEAELNAAHLEAELARLDVLINREYRRWMMAGEDPSEEFRGLHLSPERAEQYLALPPFCGLGRMGSLSSEESDQYIALERQALAVSEKLVGIARERRCPTRLDHLALCFGLDRTDLDIFLVCLAPHLDLRYERLYGFLQDDVTRRLPTLNLILDLMHGPGPERLGLLARFSAKSPLMRHHLIEWATGRDARGESSLSRVLLPDSSVVSWLFGTYQPNTDLVRDVQLSPSRAGEDDLLLAGEAWRGLEAGLAGEPVITLFGPDVTARDAAERLIADALGRPILKVDLRACSSTGHPSRDVVKLVLRDALLLDAIPVLSRWDAALEDGAPDPHVLDMICNHSGTVVISGDSEWLARNIDRDRPVLWVEFTKPSYRQRVALWNRFVKWSRLPAVLDLDDLAGQFSLSTGQIRDATATAVDLATKRGEPAGIDDLYQGARLHSNPNLAQLARKVDTRYGWPDIILPPDQVSILREIVATVRERPKVLEEWGVGRKLAASDGITVLFAGPPGTGKTMAAQVIASELKLALYKIDLSTVVSKYIGETEKNLERIFTEAQDSNSILFFDEADALFGKRSEVKDAHDRYANIEVSYLLQRMEGYDGVTVLATNLRANLDEAFVRRLQFIVDFPFPEEEDRRRIWQTLFPPELPCEEDLDLELLARRFRLAGGNIRNIIVNAAFLAAAEDRPVGMSHLLHGTRRELQKMGRLVDEADLAVD